MITCEQAREMLELSFGVDRYPAELTEHLKECTECAAYEAELNALSEEFDDGDMSVFSPAELERAALAVEAKIAAEPSPTVIPLRWMQPVLRVAAVLLVVAVSFVAFEFGRQSDGGEMTATADQDYSQYYSLYSDDLETEVMDDEMVGVLIDDFTDDYPLSAGETLVGDITEEEYQYLLENFEVGELL